ncbi:hypothetical protein WJX72_001539 [[Myrmecia] bisecta]|uniref:EML-like second beta-propeller domain-containing protein n=1 Tax=[Myrmecia] bisecta TaxID=41462 RepID=A0AAW1PM56_9CHLO
MAAQIHKPEPNSRPASALARPLDGGDGVGGPGRPQTAEGQVTLHRTRSPILPVPARDSTVVQDTNMTGEHVEGALRQSLKARRTVYMSKKQLLLRQLQAAADSNGQVLQEDFQAAAEQLGLQLDRVEVQALYDRHGYADALPCKQFVHALLTRPARQLSVKEPLRKGPFLAGQSADFSGRILYAPARRPVWTPTDWQPEAAARSAQLPDARLRLDYVYGYAGVNNTHQNIFTTSAGDIVYYTAGIAVVYHPPPVHRQHFFLGHTDDVKSIAMLKAPIVFKDVDYPAGVLFATGQVCTHDAGPCALIWDSRVHPVEGDAAAPANCPELQRIQFDKSDRGICALSFSPDGVLLVVVAMDNAHTLSIYDWRRNKLLSQGRGYMGEPPQVYGIEWNQFGGRGAIPERFVSYGKKHVKLWQMDDTGKWQNSQLAFGRLPLQNVQSAVFLPPASGARECLLVTGMASGQLYIWKGGGCCRAVSAHRPGPQLTLDDGSLGCVGVRGLLLSQDDQLVISGGADSTICFWPVLHGDLGEAHAAAPPIRLSPAYGASGKAAQVRALAPGPAPGTLVVGTSDSHIWRISSTSQELLIPGHSSDLTCVSWHPANADIMATACQSNRIFVWDARKCDMLRTAALGFTAVVLTFSTLPISGDAHHLAVGASNGRIMVLSETDLRPVAEAKDCRLAIGVMRYSPNNKYLAVGSTDTVIDIYNVAKGYQRTARCLGHSASVRHLDWSADSSLLQANCAANELLYWNPVTGKQVCEGQRDTQWASWTCALGFPVMGVWPQDRDSTDINSLDRSKGGEHVVTSDDFGLVKLFNYPCVVHDAPYRAYRGHSSHVLSVRFNNDDTWVASAGGMDQSLFQFSFHRIPPEPAAVPEPALVWGPKDALGKDYGFVRAASACFSLPPASGNIKSPAFRGQLLSDVPARLDCCNESHDGLELKLEDPAEVDAHTDDSMHASGW